MRQIGIAEWAVVEAAEHAIFATSKGGVRAARCAPFAAALSRRAVLNLAGDLFPERDGPTIAALTAAARACGDQEVLRRSESGRRASGPEARPALGIAYDTATDALDFQKPFIAAWKAGFNFDDLRGSADRFFSPSGQWGLVFDRAGWALLAGNGVFMDAFVAAAEFSLDGELRAHLRWCAEHVGEQPELVDAAWIAAHISHIVGRERGEALLREHGIAQVPAAPRGS